jgi:methionine-S-sulfoxide reductase
LGDHSEAVRIIYNPEKISYRELLHHFWNRHDPTVPQKTQYRSAVFYHNEDQKNAAEESLKEAQKSYAREILTTIESANAFYPAEDYHQDYLEKQK